MKYRLLPRTIVALLILLWIYAAFSKLLNYELSRSQMLSQIFPAKISEVLIWLVPATELLTAALLLFRQTIRAGLYVSLYLLATFTFYIGFIMTGLFGRIPCSCGGVLQEMTWIQHLFFNLFFMALTLVAIIYSSKDQPDDPRPLITPKKGGTMRKVD
jgi:putative oxidoreductase